MKITIATGPLFPVPAIRGGAVPRLWMGLAREFARRGHDVCIFARAFPGQPRRESIDGVRYLRFGGFSQSLSIKRDLLKDFVYAGSSVWRLPSAQILVTNDFWLPVFASILRRGAGRIVINANRFPKGQFRLYAGASRIAAVSTAVRNGIVAQCGWLEPRTRVIPNPVDTDVLRPAETTEARPKEKTLLFVGRLHPEKGVHGLLAAFRRIAAKHPQWQLRLIGPTAEAQGGGGPRYEEELRGLARGLAVAFMPPIFELSRLAEEYRQASLFCYPSVAETGEALPVAPLEAMASGVPPLVSSLECFRDYIDDGKTGWLYDHKNGDADGALAHRLDQLMGDPDALAEAGRRAREAATRFSYEAVAQKYLADFNELLGAGSNSTR